MVPEMSTLTSADQLIDPEMDTSAVMITEVSDPNSTLGNQGDTSIVGGNVSSVGENPSTTSKDVLNSSSSKQESQTMAPDFEKFMVFGV